MRLILTTPPHIHCPKCGDSPEVETGFFGAFLAAAILKRLERSGGTVTCHNCRHQYQVLPQNQQKLKK